MEILQSEKSNIRYIGKLDDSVYEPIIFVQNETSVRIQLKILCNDADNNFKNERIYVFGNEIPDFQFFDMYANDVKKQKIREHLKDRLLIFAIVKKTGPTENGSDIFYNAKDVEIKKVNSTIDLEEEFRAISIIPAAREVVKGTKDILAEKRYRKLTKDQLFIDTKNFDYVCIVEKDLSDDMPKNFNFIGKFNSHIYNESHGIKLEFNENLKEINKSAKQWTDYYMSNKNVMFIKEKAFEEIKNELENIGSLIAVNKKATKVSEEGEDEQKFVEKFYNVCLSKGLVYSKLDLINFHTAMKTNSFVVLAGMSGTGKSALIQCYHEAINGGKNEFTEKTLKFISVKPSWQDDSDLLGYLDTINNIYRPGDTGLVSFLKDAAKVENQDECFIICLDEMNLSKVEHYFSQFLSTLERDMSERKLNLYNVQNNSHVYNENDYPSELLIPQNVFFVGTINTDESTHKFSDKVLDRANIIELELQNFVDIKKSLARYSNTEISLKVGDKPSSFTKFKGMIANDEKGNLTEEELNFLWEIHEVINTRLFNNGVGMRIVNQIEKYLKNLPDNSELSRKEALDLQIIQRIFTKLAGSETLLKELLRIENDDLKGNIIDVLDSYSELSDFSKSRNKLKHIAMELLEYGHTL